MSERLKREVWVDSVKVIACIFVVLGHFFQSMVKSDIIQENNLYCWFNQTIYLFHVPLFFICSGYLYQKYSHVESGKERVNSILKKIISLGIPFLAFSMINWLLKWIFSNSINTELEGIFKVLFVHPTAPYWFLYCLFLIFVITPTFKNKNKAIIGLLIALVMKLFIIVYNGIDLYVLVIVLQNEIWFVLGMCLCFVNFKIIKNQIGGIILLAVFLLSSIYVFCNDISNGIASFLLGIIGCMSVIMIVYCFYLKGHCSKMFEFISKYTMPIFLMHTIFAALVRSILFKFGITNSIIHILIGLISSFIGPIVATILMSKFGCLDVIIYPNKYIKRRD